MKYTLDEREISELVKEYYRIYLGTDVDVNVSTQVTTCGYYESKVAKLIVEVSGKFEFYNGSKLFSNKLTEDDLNRILLKMLRRVHGEDSQINISYDLRCDRVCRGYGLNERSEYEAIFNGAIINTNDVLLKIVK